MLGEHLGQVAELVHEGIVVGGVRRAVRLMPSGDYEALCTVHGHRGPSETMLCLMCYCTKAPSVTHAGLDAVYGTLQDVDDPAVRHPRTSAHLVTMTTLGAPGCLPGGLLGDSSQAARRSIERRSLLTVDPRQIVPIPLHFLLGSTLRLLRLAIELIISCRGCGAGLALAYGLAETSRLIVACAQRPTTAVSSLAGTAKPSRRPAKRCVASSSAWSPRKTMRPTDACRCCGRLWPGP